MKRRAGRQFDGGYRTGVEVKHHTFGCHGLTKGRVHCGRIWDHPTAGDFHTYWCADCLERILTKIPI
jgi:hypothetical protein